MKTNTVLSTTLTDKKLQTLLKKLVKRPLQSSETHMRYYGGGGLVLRLNLPIVLVEVKKLKLGTIFYISNAVYSVGEFIFLTDKEIMLLNPLANFDTVKKDFIVGQWRHLWYWESIVNEFENPLKEIDDEISLLEKKLISIEENSISIQAQLENAKKNQKEISKRF